MGENVGVREGGKGGSDRGVGGRRKPVLLVVESKSREERENARFTNAASPSTEGSIRLGERQVRAEKLGAKPGKKGKRQVNVVIGKKPLLMKTSVG